MGQEPHIIDYNAADIPVSVKKLKPVIWQDGKTWKATYGNQGETAVTGAGKTPVEAMADFDRDYQEKKQKAVDNNRTN